jgi:hypothetical protein
VVQEAQMKSQLVREEAKLPQRMQRTEELLEGLQVQRAVDKLKRKAATKQWANEKSFK